MRIVTEYNATTLVDVIEIISATYIGDYVIRIDFNDGVSREVNFKPFLKTARHPSIRQYLNKEKFRKFVIIDGNLNWNNYELIFPLAELHDGQINVLLCGRNRFGGR